MRVGVITTGTAELAGLHVALKGLFPDHEFTPIPERRPDRPFNGFTSSKISGSDPVDIQSTAGKLVRAAAAALEHHDRVIILDDLEIDNLDQIPAVLEYVRAHVETYRRWFSSTYGQTEANALVDRLRTRASFHLAVPMLESWFFADPAALPRMNVTGTPKFAPAGDPERFQTSDQAYDADDCSNCTAWLAIADPKKRRANCPEWDRVDRQRHPKAYLAWLMKDPGNKRCSQYRETKQGVTALQALDWQRSLVNPDHCAYMRALVFDLSIVLNVPLPWLNRSSRPALTDPKWTAGTLHNI